MHRARPGSVVSACLLAAPVLLCGGCGLKYIDPDRPEDLRWRELPPAPARKQPVGASTPRRSSVRRSTAPTRPASRPAKKTERKAILAVFNLEDRGVGLSAATLRQLGDYLFGQLAASGRFRLIPRDQLQQRLEQRGHKAADDRHCVERGCQIAIGRQLAAEQTLATVVMRLGSRCRLTAVLYDIRRGVAVGGGSADADCTEDSIVIALRQVVASVR